VQVRSRKPRVIILLLYEACREAAKTRDVHYRHPYQYTDFKRVTSFEKRAASTMAVNAAASDEEAAKAFRRIDADNSGELDLAEMGKLSRFFGKPLSHEQLMAAFEEIDTDQSGTIDMQEFLVWWRRHHGMAYARDGGPTEKRSRAVTETAELTGEVGGQDGWEGESDEWHADVFALLSAEVLGERLLVSGAPPVEGPPTCFPSLLWPLEARPLGLTGDNGRARAAWGWVVFDPAMCVVSRQPMRYTSVRRGCTCRSSLRWTAPIRGRAR
jgi:hypothetical protein